MKKEKVMGLAAEKVEKVSSGKRNSLNRQMWQMTFFIEMNMMTIVMTKLQAASSSENTLWGHSSPMDESQVLNLNFRVRSDHVMYLQMR